MKRYKLLKDLPYAKAGEVFERTTHKSEDGLSDYDYLEIRKRVSVGEDETHFGIQYNYFLDNFNEWFEEIQEPTDSIHWRPRIGDRYWFYFSDGGIRSRFWDNEHEDIGRYELGRTYRTEEECKKAYDRELAEVRLRRTSTFKPGFENGNGGYVVYYDYCFHQLSILSVSSEDSGEPVFYATEEEAEESIKENEQDWKIYFGIEEEIND